MPLRALGVLKQERMNGCWRSEGYFLAESAAFYELKIPWGLSGMCVVSPSHTWLWFLTVDFPRAAELEVLAFAVKSRFWSVRRLARSSSLCTHTQTTRDVCFCRQAESSGVWDWVEAACLIPSKGNFEEEIFAMRSYRALIWSRRGKPHSLIVFMMPCAAVRPGRLLVGAKRLRRARVQGLVKKMRLRM